MEQQELNAIISQFAIDGTVKEIKPLGNGLINTTYKVNTAEADCPDYVLQLVNTSVFTDIDLLMHNIDAVTRHIRHKLQERGESDIERKVLHFFPTKSDGKLYYRAADGRCWRIMKFIPDAETFEAVTPKYSYFAGKAFGNFEAMLVDIPEKLGETIPDFHNMELRMRQLHEVMEQDPMRRLAGVKNIIDELEASAHEMCKAERLYREGKLPKRICHCDTKVNNMMFDKNGEVLCVIDLDTVMPSFIFSDYGDFLRTGANFVAEDDPHYDKVGFNVEIFKAFTRGYIESAGSFLTPIEIENLPFAVALFPFMQSVRFMWDYLNGDKYWKVNYPEHNLTRATNQLYLYRSVRAHDDEMKAFIDECRKS